MPSSIQIAVSYEKAATLQLSSRYGQLFIDATNDQQIEQVQEIDPLESKIIDNSTADNQLSAEENIEGAISRKHITKSMTAKSRALHEDILKVSPTTVEKIRKNIAKINNSTKKNAVVLLSSLTNKIHIARF